MGCQRSLAVAGEAGWNPIDSKPEALASLVICKKGFRIPGMDRALCEGLPGNAGKKSDALFQDLRNPAPPPLFE